MTLNYQLTFYDYREAHVGVKKPVKTWLIFVWTVGWLLFFGLAIALILLLTDAPRIRSLNSPDELPPSAIARFCAAMLPSLFFLSLFGFALLRQSMRPLPKPWAVAVTSGRKAQTSQSAIVGWTFFILMAAAIFLALDSRPRSVSSPVSGSGGSPVARAWPTLLDCVPGIVPWIAMAVMLVIVSRLGGERVRRRAWDAQPFLQRPENVEINENGITFTEELSRKQYAWSYFPGFKETPNLFLIYVSPLGFHILPKRAFPTAAELDLFRGYLLNEIKTGQFLDHPAAFPVVPLASKAPTTPPPPLPRVN